MTAQQVVRWCRAIARCAAALADELEKTEPGRAEVTADAEGDWDPQDVCEVGDPDPTPPNRIVDLCGLKSPHERLMCTRVPDHTGQHVAGFRQTVAEVWPGDATSQRDDALAPGWGVST